MSAERTVGEGAVEVRGVRHAYGENVVLDGLSATFPAGTVTAVLGANGSGKTTLGRLLLGLEVPAAGVVAVPPGVRRAAVFQDERLCEHLSAVGNARLVVPRSVPRAQVEAGLHAVGLGGEELVRPVRELSGGQRRRVAIVRALVGDAGLVVLDEPFTGLDTAAREATRTWVRERLAGRVAVLITHDPDDVAWFGAREVRLG
jgi:NitT/TauT family transport system ATP-binding protein